LGKCEHIVLDVDSQRLEKRIYDFDKRRNMIGLSIRDREYED